MRLEVTIDDREVAAALRAFPEKVARPAARRASERALRSTAALQRKLISEELNVRLGLIKAYQYVTVGATGGRIVVLGLGVPLEQFVGFRYDDRGATVRVLRRRGGKTRIPHVFQYPGKGGGFAAIRERAGGRRVPRGPVDRLFGPSPANVAGRKRVLDQLSRHLQERFTIEVLRDIERRVAGFGRRLSGPSTTQIAASFSSPF